MQRDHEPEGANEARSPLNDSVGWARGTGTASDASARGRPDSRQHCFTIRLDRMDLARSSDVELERLLRTGCALNEPSNARDGYAHRPVDGQGRRELSRGRPLSCILARFANTRTTASPASTSYIVIVHDRVSRSIRAKLDREHVGDERITPVSRSRNVGEGMRRDDAADIRVNRRELAVEVAAKP